MKGFALAVGTAICAFGCAGGPGAEPDGGRDHATMAEAAPEAAGSEAGEDVPTTDAGAADAGDQMDSGTVDAAVGMDSATADAVVAGDGGDAAAMLVLPPRSALAVNVQVTVDTARASTKLIQTYGGSVTATGADGTIYQLDVYPEALLRATTITLTPIISIQDVPGTVGAKGAWGVKMEPEGLVLYKPITLIIKPPASGLVPLEKQLFLQWEGDGAQLGLAPIEPTGGLRLPVLHFSGVAMMQSDAVDRDLTEIRRQLGGAPEELVADLAGAYLQRDRLRQLRGSGGAELAALHDAIFGDLASGLVDEIVARYPNAAADCTKGWLTIVLAQRYWQLLGLCGVQGPWHAQALDLVETVSFLCMNDLFAECRDRHIVHRMLAAGLEEERRRSLIGVPASDPDLPKLDAYVTGCLKFELDVDSTGRQKSTNQYQTVIEETMQARSLPVTLKGTHVDWLAGKTVISGSGPFVSVAYTFTTLLSCLKQGTNVVMPATFQVKNLSLVTTPAPGDALGDFTLVYATMGGGDAVGTVDVCYNNTGTIGTNWLGIHQVILGKTNPYDYGVGGYSLASWVVSPMTEIGRKTVQEDLRTTPDGSNNVYDLHTEDLFVLRHVPALPSVPADAGAGN